MGKPIWEVIVEKTYRVRPNGVDDSPKEIISELYEELDLATFRHDKLEKDIGLFSDKSFDFKVYLLEWKTEDL